MLERKERKPQQQKINVCQLHNSTCFEQKSAHRQESQLYKYNLWYMSLYVGDRVVYRFRWNCIPHGHLHTVTYTVGRIDTIDSPDDEHLVPRNM